MDLSLSLSLKCIIHIVFLEVLFLLHTTQLAMCPIRLQAVALIEFAYNVFGRSEEYQ